MEVFTAGDGVYRYGKDFFQVTNLIHTSFIV